MTLGRSDWLRPSMLGVLPPRLRLPRFRLPRFLSSGVQAHLNGCGPPGIIALARHANSQIIPIAFRLHMLPFMVGA
jgi:hypothetical protein